MHGILQKGKKMKKNNVTTIINDNINTEAVKKKIRIKKQNVLEAEIALQTAKDQLDDVKKECPHDIVETEWGAARCTICDSDSLGWFCPNSQDHVCHYWWEVDMQNNTVELCNGKTAHVGEIEPDEHGENCIFCGQPEERK